MKAKTYFIVEYNDRYGTGKNKMFECIVKDKNDFIAWLKQHNEKRLEEGASEEDEEEFNLIPLNLFNNP